MKISFEKEVIVITLLLALVGWLSLGENGFSLFCGGAWGCANFFLIQQIVKQFFFSKGKKRAKLALLVALKCPLLYFLGYYLLKRHTFSLIYLLLGLSLLFVTMFLVGIGDILKRKKI